MMDNGGGPSAAPGFAVVDRRAGRAPLAWLWLMPWFLGMVVLLWLGAQDYGVANQFALALVVLAVLAALRITGLAKLCRTFFIFAAAFLSWRYLSWRVADTLPDPGTLAFIPGVLLFAAEIYGILMLFLGVFVNIRPIDRATPPLPADPEHLPRVDVFVPTYNEDEALLETTLIAASRMRYPKEKLNVWLLDDGGTDQKQNDQDPRRAQAAISRNRSLQMLCARLGCHYLTRSFNEHAKAGNINAALGRTDGELILILDADHVPTEDLLERTVGHFGEDPKLFMVQSPHFFINPDPLERNLGTFSRMPSENEMFYQVGQRGLDSWNASFFCGSAAILRRTHLISIGGIQGTSITEDAETALELHARGLTSRYVARPMIAGLSPETFSSFIGQRSRWAQGMIQIMLLKNPLWKRGLSLAQRLSYLSSMVFWLFPIARMLFLITPLAYLFFGLQIYRASYQEFVAYGLAHLAASLILTNFLFGHVRWPFISELYEIAQSPFLVRAIGSVFLRPRAPTFKVTAKSETLERNFVSELARPLLLLLGLLSLAAIAGLWRWHAFPLERENIAIVLGWNLFNLLFVLGAIGVVHEHKQRRGMPRVPRTHEAEASLGGNSTRVRISDLSIGGAQLTLNQDAEIYRDLAHGNGGLIVELAGGTRTIPFEIRHAVVEDDLLVLGVRFDCQTEEQRADVVALCFGSSEAWVAFQAERQQPRTVLGGFAHFARLCIVKGTLGILAGLHQDRPAPSPAGHAGSQIILPQGARSDAPAR
ncbi:UDP-forming cellulose synthase catalytic subunit [Geminicoccus roseus]|uniref:UDP-forming cellulose synthase catalytic subunit n=1 Tax=Geminicoccus roseus TaxID=404900 RepID=UPI000687085B|nr:UDP-forming cellulose synthase catalytic subunit [Geminicoccus roseus]